MQKDSRQGDLDETVVAGSLPASPSTPPSSRAELSPLVTSTPKQSREFSKESNTKSTERKDNEQAQGLIGSSISQSTESDKRDATKLEGSATSTGGSGIQSIKNLLSLGARPKSPKVSRWAALKKQETSQSSRSSLWQHVVNSSIINIHDIGSGVDGAPARKAEPKPKPLWKFNRPADVGSSNEVEAAENDSEAANAERKGESRESISEPSSPEIPQEKEQAMEMSDMEKLSEVLTEKGDIKDIVGERPSTQLPSEKELVRKASDKEKSLEEVSKELGNANETPEIFKEAIDKNEKNDYLKNPVFISNQETEQSKEAIFDLNQDESNEISFEVPEALKTYIDPLCTEWQDPNNRKMIYKLAVQKYYSDTGTKFESADACLLKPTKQLLKATYSRRSSLKGGAIPGDLLKTMLKEKAAVELADRRHSCNEETWKQNRPETGYLKRKTMSEDGVGLSGSGLGNKDDSLKRSHLEKETAEFSHRTPGYGAYSFHNLSRLVIPEMEEDEANIAMSVRRKSDLDISSHHNWKPPKLALEDSFKRSHKSLPSVIKNKTKHFLKKYDNENAENQKMMGEKNPPDNCDQDLSKETISSKLPEALEQWNHPKKEKESTGIESSSIASSKELIVSENHGEDSDVDQQVQQTTVVKADLPERKMRSVTEIQREGYGEVDFNSPTLVLENLKINTSTEGEDNKESTDQALETKNPNNEKKGPSALLINSTMTEGSKSRGISPTAEPENEEGVDTTDAIDNSPKLATKNPDIESIKLLLQTTLDQQSALLQKQSLVSAIILQSLQKGNLKEEDLSTLVSLHEAGEINLEKSTPKNIMMIQPKEGEPSTKIQSGKKSLDGKLVNRAQGHKHKDHSLPSEVLKRKLEKVIKEKVPLDKTERTESPNSSIDKGYESGVDTSAHTENNTLDQDQLEERESRRFCFANREETEECNDTRDLIKRLNPSSVLVESISDEELEVYTPSSISFSKSYSDRKLRGFSERSSSHLDDYDEELISFYSHEDFDVKKKVSGQSKDIYEMGSNMQLCNFHVQPSNNSLKVQETSHLSYNKYKTEYTAREINTEPGAIIYKLNNPNTVPAKDVRFKDSPLFLRNSDDYPSELSDPVSSVASFPHINSLEVTANQSYQALSDDGSQEESEELINLPPKRVTSIRDFLKLLYSRDPEFIRQSLSSADCEYTTLKQLLHAFSSLTTDGSANDVAEVPLRHVSCREVKNRTSAYKSVSLHHFYFPISYSTQCTCVLLF